MDEQTRQSPGEPDARIEAAAVKTASPGESDSELSSSASGVARTCHFCGEKLKPGACFCNKCERYQPASTTEECRFCREWIPRGALHCNKCEKIQHGYRRFLPISSATVSAFAALISLVILFLSNLERFETKHSKTNVTLTGSKGDQLMVLVQNHGNQSAFLGGTWLRVAKDCGWDTLCPRSGGHQPGAKAQPVVVSRDILRLDVVDPAASLADPGLSAVELGQVKKVPIPRDVFPEGLLPNCDNFKELIPELRLCLGVEIREYGERGTHCEQIDETANLYKDYVWRRLNCRK